MTNEEFDAAVMRRVEALRAKLHASKPAHQWAREGLYHEVNSCLSWFSYSNRDADPATKLDALVRIAAISKLAAEGF